MTSLSLNRSKAVLLLFGILCLSGCKNSYKQLNMSMAQESLAEQREISVEQLLLNAREQTLTSNRTVDLYLQFEPSHKQLNSEQKQQLIRFAKQDPKPVFLACGPSLNPDRFTSAAIAIQRCQQIGLYLHQHSMNCEILLSPRLQPDQVRVYR